MELKLLRNVGAAEHFPLCALHPWVPRSVLAAGAAVGSCSLQVVLSSVINSTLADPVLGTAEVHTCTDRAGD